MSDTIQHFLGLSCRFRASCQTVYDIYRIFIPSISDSGHDFQVTDQEKFFFGLDFLEALSWKMHLISDGLLEEMKKFHAWAATNAPGLAQEMEKEDGVLESLDTINDWWKRHFDRGFGQEEKQRLFQDGYYNRMDRGGYFNLSLTIIGVHLDSAKEIVLLWERLKKPSPSRIQQNVARVFQAISGAIDETVGEQVDIERLMSWSTLQAGLSNELGLDELDTLEVLSAVERRLTGTSGHEKFTEALQTKAELRDTSMTAISHEEAQDAMRGTWEIDIRRAQQLASMPLKQFIGWVCDKI